MLLLLERALDTILEPLLVLLLLGPLLQASAPQTCEVRADEERRSYLFINVSIRAIEMAMLARSFDPLGSSRNEDQPVATVSCDSP